MTHSQPGAATTVVDNEPIAAIATMMTRRVEKKRVICRLRGVWSGREGVPKDFQSMERVVSL